MDSIGTPQNSVSGKLYSHGQKSVIFCVRNLLTRNITDFCPQLYCLVIKSMYLSYFHTDQPIYTIINIMKIYKI